VHRVRHGYWLALLAAALGVAAYAAVGQIYAAHNPAQVRQDAAETAATNREALALSVKAAQILASLPGPRSLRPSVGICTTPASKSVCFTSRAEPSRAIVPAVASAASVMQMQPTNCDVPTRQSRFFGKNWTPCTAHAAVISDRNGRIFLTVTAFPTIARSTADPATSCSRALASRSSSTGFPLSSRSHRRRIQGWCAGRANAAE
jgi:hypothetical protein